MNQEAIIAELRMRNVACHFEYPGFIAMYPREGVALNVSEMNGETIEIQVADKDGELIDVVPSSIPTGCEDVMRVADFLACAFTRWTRAAEIAKTIIAEVLRNPEWLAARSFSELHDHCDANMLGEQEAFLLSCGWTGQDVAKDAEALAASTDVLNDAQTIVGHWLAARK